MVAMHKLSVSGPEPPKDTDKQMYRRSVHSRLDQEEESCSSWTIAWFYFHLFWEPSDRSALEVLETRRLLL